MHDSPRDVVGGVDTHLEVHVASIVDTTGRILDDASFQTTVAGYRALLGWMRRHGDLVRVGVEGTGAYGAGLARFLTGEGVEVVEVNRPDRQRRRRHGKTDTVDAEAAARAALNGDANAIPKSADGRVEAIRALRIVRRSALKARTQASNQLAGLVITAPDRLRSRLGDRSTKERVEICARFRTTDLADPEQATKTAMRSLARRHLELTEEIGTLDGQLAELCAETNPALLAAHGVGTEVAAALLVTAGDNPHRMTSEAAFAALCGVSPVEASSGKITRHRLNRSGDRQANNALWRIALVRMATDERTKTYVIKRTREGKTKREIIRCLKRYIAREIYRLIINPPHVTTGRELRSARKAAELTLAEVAEALGVWPTRLSELERGIRHDAEFAGRCHQWLNEQQAA